MIIISQNGDTVADSFGASIYLQEKEIIFDRLGVRNEVLGVYPDESRAKVVFSEMVQRFKIGSDGYFEMPKE